MFYTVSKYDAFTLARKMTSFCFPKKVLCFRIGLRLELAELRLNTFSVKRPFGQVS